MKIVLGFFYASIATTVFSIIIANWVAIAGSVLTLVGTWIAYKSMQISQTSLSESQNNADREEFNLKIISLEKDLSEDIRYLKADFLVSIKEIKESLNNSTNKNELLMSSCIDRVNILLIELREHTSKPAHEGTASDIVKIKESLSKMKESIILLELKKEDSNIASQETQKIIIEKLINLELSIANINSLK